MTEIQFPDSKFLHRSVEDQNRVIYALLLKDQWSPVFRLVRTVDSIGMFVKHPKPLHACGDVLKVKPDERERGYYCPTCGSGGWLSPINRDEFLRKHAQDKHEKALKALAGYEAHGSTPEVATALYEALKEAMS